MEQNTGDLGDLTFGGFVEGLLPGSEVFDEADLKETSDMNLDGDFDEQCSEDDIGLQTKVTHPKRGQHMTSLCLFRKFLTRRPDMSIDASQIHSIGCYQAWLQSRKVVPSEPEKTFQRNLSSHLTAIDDRSPFTEEEERAILEVLRRKERWPCFAHCSVRFGQNGFRAKGFHEKRALQSTHEKEFAPSPAAARKRPIVGAAMSVPKRFTDASLIQSRAESHMPAEHATDFLTQRFTTMCLFLVSRVAMMASELYKYAFIFIRMMLLSAGYARPHSFEDVQRLSDMYTRTFPDECVLIVNTMTSEWRNRYVYQNEVSKQFFGSITTVDGGYPGELIIENDSQRALSVQLSVFSNRGKKEVTHTLLFMCLGGVKIPFGVTIYMDPMTYLVVIHGKPA